MPGSRFVADKYMLDSLTREVHHVSQTVQRLGAGSAKPTYLYAAEGVVPQQFEHKLLKDAFKTK